jgi:hypothetical protein
MWTEGWTDSQDERNIRFSDICEAHNIVQFVLFLKHSQDELLPSTE